MAQVRGKRLVKDRERKAIEQASRKRAADRRRMVVIAIAAVGVIALGTAWIFFAPAPSWDIYQDLGNEHLEAINQPHIPYNSSPPSSGPHIGSLVGWEEYDEQVPPEAFVHNLEDGGIALTYDCPTGCEGVTGVLRTVLNDYSGDNVLMFPYEDIIDSDGVSHASAAVAWGRVIYFDDFSDSATEKDLRSFINSFEGINNHVAVNQGHG